MTFIFQENISTMGAKPNNNIVKRKANPLQDRTNSRNAFFSPNGKVQKSKKMKPIKASQQPRRLPASRGYVPKKATNVVDIDKDDHKDPLAATEYVVDVHQELRKREAKMSPQPNYIGNQPKLHAPHVLILIDWLIEVQTRYGDNGERLSPHTLYLATNLIHNFLAKNEVIEKDKLQVVGVTAFLIASKYEDIDPPTHNELEYMCAHAYTSQNFLDMEVRILTTLDYHVSAPTALNFLHRFLKAAGATQEMAHIANFILDGSLLSYSTLEFLPSQQAAAAVYIANRKATGYRTPWNATLEYYTGYKESEVMAVAQSILKANASIPSECESVRNKYAQDRYGNLSSKFTFTF